MTDEDKKAPIISVSMARRFGKSSLLLQLIELKTRLAAQGIDVTDIPKVDISGIRPVIIDDRIELVPEAPYKKKNGKRKRNPDRWN